MEALPFYIPHIYRMAAYYRLAVTRYMLENSPMPAQRIYFLELLRYVVMVYVSLNRYFQCSDQQISTQPLW